MTIMVLRGALQPKLAKISPNHWVTAATMGGETTLPLSAIKICRCRAIWSPPQGVCKGETQIVTSSMNFCIIEKLQDGIKELQNLPCVENPRNTAQTLRRCK